MILQFKDPGGSPVAFDAEEVSDMKPVMGDTATEVFLKNSRRYYIGEPFDVVFRRVEEAKSRK